MDFVIGIVGAIFGGGFFAFVQFLITRNDSRKEIDICLLGIIIRDTCEQAIKNNSISTEKLRQVKEANELYKKIGGNGYIKTLMTKIDKLEIVEE